MRRKLLCLFTALALAAFALYAQGAKRAMTFDDILNLKVVSDPQLSPDGRYVAFVVSRADLKENLHNTDIWLVGVEEGKPLQLTYSPKRDEMPRWSPDGRTIAFLSNRDGKDQIYLINPFGGEARKLTEHKTSIQRFAWSPDGKQIAFAARKTPKLADALTTEVYIVSSNGGEPAQLTKNSYAEQDVRWSPDGKMVSYLSNSDKFPSIGPERVHLLRLDGAKSTAPGRPKVLLPNFDGYIRRHFWSQDGRAIYFEADMGLNRHIFRMTSEGSELVQLTEDGVNGPFTLSLSSNHIAFLSETPAEPADVWFANLEGAPWSGSLARAKRLTNMNRSPLMDIYSIKGFLLQRPDTRRPGKYFLFRRRASLHRRDLGNSQ